MPPHLDPVPRAGELSSIAVRGRCSARLCAGGAAHDGPAATSPADAAAQVAQIKSDWAAFFNPSTPDSTRVRLLENGDRFAPATASFWATPMGSVISSKVDSVTFTSATTAHVTYDQSALGTTVAAGAKGTTVLQAGTWKVGDDAFCSLLKAGAAAGTGMKIPSACG